MKKLLPLALAFCFLLTAAARAEGYQQERKPIYIITRTVAEGAFIARLAAAEKLSAVIITESDYASAPDGSIITTLPAVAKDAKNAGIAPLCLGARFDSDENVSLSAPEDVSVNLTYGEYTQTDQFVGGIRLLAAQNGTGEGLIRLAGGREYSFAAKCESAWYIPWYDGEGLCALAAANLIGEYCGAKNWPQMFLMIDEVYPFSNLDELRAAADMLCDSGLPFIARVMPVYDNLDYPAFYRYADTLRYVQSRGGTIVIHPLIEKPAEALREPPEERLARFQGALEAQGVHCFPMEYEPLKLSMDALEKITTEGREFPAPQTDVAVPFEAGENAAALLGRVNAKWLDISDYRLRYTTDKYTYEKREIADAYVYIEEEKLMLAKEFTLGNDVLYILIMVILLVFGVFFMIGRRLYRRKFFK